MIIKHAIRLVDGTLEALNKPDWYEYNMSRVKFASIQKDKNDLGGFDLESAVKESPDFLFVKVFAIKEDEVNDNGDAFSSMELKKAAKSFIGVPIFTNHQNDDVEKAKGQCVHAWYDKNAEGIWIISKIDRVAYPQLARGIEEKYVAGTSMGAMSGDAEILMSDYSKKRISDVEIGEKVITHLGNCCKVEEVHSDFIDEHLLKFDLGNLANSPLFTQDHPIFSINGKTIREQKKNNKDWRSYPYDCIFREAKDLKLGDYVLIPSAHKMVKENEFDLDFYYLLGAFAGDGYIKFNRGKIEGFGFCFGNQDIALISKIKNILSQYTDFDIKEKIIESRNGVYLSIYDRKLANKLNTLIGHGAYTKRIKIKEFSENAIKQFISGYIDTDGCSVKDYTDCKNDIRGFQISSCNKNLLESVRSMLVLIGCPAGIMTNIRKPNKNSVVDIETIEHTLFINLFTSSRFKNSIKVAQKLNGYEASYCNTPNMIYRVGDQNYIAARIKGVILVDNYDNEVYDLTVEKDASYIANNIAVHNCSVEYSVCSICHNKAHTADEYCDHIKNHKTRKVSETTECQYHKSPNKPIDDCPVCGKKHNESKKLSHKEAQVFEWNYDVKFIEDSFVVNPACHTCNVNGILNPNGMNRKVATIRDRIGKLEKAASSENDWCLEKTAGERELKYLTDAMDKIETVAKSMMSQKKQISMEYVSDLVDVLASVQATLDELEEMGYAQLPSPSVQSVEDVELPKEAEEETEIQPQSQAVQPLNAAPTIPPAGQPPVQQVAPGIESEQLGDLGSVTRPKFSETIEIKKKDFLRASSSIIDRLDKIQENYTKLEKNSEANQTKIDKESITMANKTGNDQNENEKVAEHDLNVITEKQLDDAEFTGERTNDSPNVITEKQLDNPKDVNVTTSKTPQERSGSYDVITEKQLASIKEGYVVRWNDFPNVITEKQWTDMSRLLGSELSNDQSNRITEKQLTDFMSKHKYVSPTVIYEKLLNGQDGELARWASADTNTLVKIAENVIADAIAYYGKTPDEIRKAASTIDNNGNNQEKAAFLVVINSLAHKADARESERVRYNYLSKLSSSAINTPSAVDALVIAMSDNIADQDAFELIEVVNHVAKSKVAIKRIEAIAKSKLSGEGEDKKVVSKQAAIEEAIANLNKADDGKYRIVANFGSENDKDVDLHVSPENKTAFTSAVYKFANDAIAEEVGTEVDTALLDVNVDSGNNVVVATLKDVSVLTDEEKTSWDKVAQSLQSLVEDPTKPSRSFLPDAETPLAKEGLDILPEPGEEELAIGVDDIDLEGVDLDLELDVSGAPGSLNEELFEGEGKDMLMGDEEVIKDMSMGTEDEMALDIEDARGGPVFASRKDKRDGMVKEAQLLGGEMGGQGGAAQGPGAGAGLPQPPAGGEAPLESFEGSDLGGEFEDEGDLQPKPPGSICPVCSSENVDIIKGEGKCNNCTSEFKYKVAIEVTKWADLLEDQDNGDEEEDIEGEGFEIEETPEAAAPPAAPAPPAAAPAPAPMPGAASTDNDKIQKFASVDRFASMTVIKPEAIKVAKEAGIELGTVSPVTGSANTMKLEDGRRFCLDTGTPYSVEYAVDKNDPKKVYAQWSWKPPVDEGCSECAKSHQQFVESLSTMNITEDQFDSMGLKEKGETILSMKQAGLLKQIKTASAETNNMIKKATVTLGDNFPMESCVEKLARRYGEDALALSGPCEGKPLADCICASLKRSGMYSSRLANKVASIWSDKEASTECLEDYVRMGFELKEAAAVCQALKTKYASPKDVYAQQLGEIIEQDEEVDVPVADDEVGVTDLGDEDPFDGEEVEGAGDVTITLPGEVVEQLDAALDTALGETPEEEAHHEEGIDVTEDVGGPAEEAVDVAEGAEEMVPMEGGEVGESKDMGGEVVEIGIEDGGEEVGGIGEVGEVVEDEVGEVVEDEGEIGGDIGEDIADETAAPQGLAEVVEEVVEAVEEAVEKVKEIIDEKNGVEEEGILEEDENSEGNDLPGVLNPEETDVEVEKEGEEEETEMDFEEKEAAIMNRNYIGRTDEIAHLDFSKLASVIKGADTIKIKPAQDVVPFQYSATSTIGDEDAFTADKATAPHKGDAAAIGNEEPPKAEKASAPTSDARMSGEKDNTDLKPELDDVATGGEEGAGTSKAASTKERISNLADAIIKAQANIEAQTKVKRKFVQDDEDTKPYSGDSFIGNEKESIGDVPAAKPAIEQKVPTDQAFIGNEKESIGEKPSDADMPDIPTKDSRIDGEKDNEKIAPEKDDEMTGDVTNGGVNAESHTHRKEATRVAGRMLQAGKISIEDLATKIAELERYESGTLNDIENSIFDEKGLNTQSEGLEQAPVVSEDSNQIKVANSQDELAKQLTGMFSLSRRNEAAQEDSDIQLRKDYGR
jgi:intein/homing endonuclease